MANTKLTKNETALVEDALEVGCFAFVNPMCGGAVAIEARRSRAEVEAELAPLGFGVSWDRSGNYGGIVRLGGAS